MECAIAVVACSCCAIQRVTMLTALASLNVQEHDSFGFADIHFARAAATRSRTSEIDAVTVEHRGAPQPLAMCCRPAELP